MAFVLYRSTINPVPANFSIRGSKKECTNTSNQYFGMMQARFRLSLSARISNSFEVQYIVFMTEECAISNNLLVIIHQAGVFED